MQTIKKYTNRKLYHTNRKQYITLDRIAALIQAGEDVRVVDNESGEDITAPILAQVVAQARHSGGLLPTHVLTDLIQASLMFASAMIAIASILHAIGGFDALARRHDAFQLIGADDGIHLGHFLADVAAIALH